MQTLASFLQNLYFILLATVSVILLFEIAILDETIWHACECTKSQCKNILKLIIVLISTGIIEAILIWTGVYVSTHGEISYAVEEIKVLTTFDDKYIDVYRTGNSPVNTYLTVYIEHPDNIEIKTYTLAQIGLHDSDKAYITVSSGVRKYWIFETKLARKIDIHLPGASKYEQFR